MKTCFKCGEQRPLSDFYKHPQMADGHLGKCKKCTKEDVRKNYRDNKERYQEYEKERELNPDRKAKKLEYQRKRRKAHLVKDKARAAVTRGLRNGSLEKQPCEICGDEKVEAHHDDYSKPLEVRWLCFKHHRQEHGQLQEEI